MLLPPCLFGKRCVTVLRHPDMCLNALIGFPRFCHSGWKRRLGGHSAAQLLWELNQRELVQAQVLAGPAGSAPTLAFRASLAALDGQQRRRQQQL